jgi:hypothetical protein
MVNTAEGFKANIDPVPTNNFEMAVMPPPFLINDPAFDQFKWAVRTAPVPAETTGEIELPFKGLAVYIAGDNTYSPISTTILNDKKGTIYKVIQKWRAYMKSDPTGTRANDMKYKTVGYIYTKDGNDNVIMTKAFIGIWPQEVGELTHDHDSQNEVQKFDVSWRFDYPLDDLL